MQSQNLYRELLRVKWQFDIQHNTSVKPQYSCAIYPVCNSQNASSNAGAESGCIILITQSADFSSDTDVHAPAQSPTLCAGSCCNEAQRPPALTSCQHLFVLSSTEYHLSVPARLALSSSLCVEASCPGSSLWVASCECCTSAQLLEQQQSAAQRRVRIG